MAKKPPRKILPFISDYFSDMPNVSKDKRIEHYQMVETALGVKTIRLEIRMKDLVKQDLTINEETKLRYVESLAATKLAGMTTPIICLFSPAPWMVVLASEDSAKFWEMFRKYLGSVAEICHLAGVIPDYIQVLNEINWTFQTPFKMEVILKTFEVASQIFRQEFETKIMTTIYANNNAKPPYFERQGNSLRGKMVGIVPAWRDWRTETREIVKAAGESLQALGFDFYPGSYELFGQFDVVKGYEWLAKEKLQHGGALSDKDILIAEIGVPAFFRNRFFFNQNTQLVGYQKIVGALGQFLDELEVKGCMAEELFKGVGFFTSVELDPKFVNHKLPFALDFLPWALIRKNKAGWEVSPAGYELKKLIKTKIWYS